MYAIRHFLKNASEWTAISQLYPGTPTAHTRTSLVLLPSGPDTVRMYVLRGTRASTPLDSHLNLKIIPLEMTSILL